MLFFFSTDEFAGILKFPLNKPVRALETKRLISRIHSFVIRLQSTEKKNYNDDDNNNNKLLLEKKKEKKPCLGKNRKKETRGGGRVSCDLLKSQNDKVKK